MLGSGDGWSITIERGPTEGGHIKRGGVRRDIAVLRERWTGTNRWMRGKAVAGHHRLRRSKSTRWAAQATVTSDRLQSAFQIYCIDICSLLIDTVATLPSVHCALTVRRRNRKQGCAHEPMVWYETSGPVFERLRIGDRAGGMPKWDFPRFLCRRKKRACLPYQPPKKLSEDGRPISPPPSISPSPSDPAPVSLLYLIGSPGLQCAFSHLTGHYGLTHTEVGSPGLQCAFSL